MPAKPCAGDPAQVARLAAAPALAAGRCIVNRAAETTRVGGSVIAGKSVVCWLAVGLPCGAGLIAVLRLRPSVWSVILILANVVALRNSNAVPNPAARVVDLALRHEPRLYLFTVPASHPFYQWEAGR